jgi:hypothetical protein
MRALQERWEVATPVRVVHKNHAPPSLGDPIAILTPVDTSRVDVVHNAASVIPKILVPGLPADRYPAYIAFLYRATLAALKCDHPALHRTLTEDGDYSVVGTAVAVHAGMVAAFGPTAAAEQHRVGSQLVYDTKRSRLWMRAGGTDDYANQWRITVEASPGPDAVALEVMLVWAKVAPLVACMASCLEYALGGGYSTRFVQDAISRYMKSRMSSAAYSTAYLKHALTWDVACAASISGYPAATARAWAVDPLLAVCAERRIMVDAESLRASREREARLRDSYDDTMLEALSDRTAHGEVDDALWQAVSAARGAVLEPDDDACSVATALMQEATLGTTGDEHDGTYTMVPSRAPTPPGEVSPQHRQEIQDIIRGAAASGARAMSETRNLYDTTSVRW